MQAVAGISFVLLVACAWSVGVRLLLLARRTRALPETCLGSMILCLMGIGYPLAIGAQAEPLLGLAAAKLLQSLSNGFIDIGFALIFVFTWRVFRRHDRRARALVWVAISALLLHWGVVTPLVMGLESMSRAVEITSHWALIALVTGCIGNAWSALESLRYRGMLQRRLAVGLGDPVVSNRFLLWGAMGVATSLGALANLYFLLARIDVVTHPLAQSVTSLAGITQSALLYLTFLAPAAYTSWLLEPRRASA